LPLDANFEGEAMLRTTSANNPRRVGRFLVIVGFLIIAISWSLSHQKDLILSAQDNEADVPTVGKPSKGSLSPSEAMLKQRMPKDSAHENISLDLPSTPEGERLARQYVQAITAARSAGGGTNATESEAVVSAAAEYEAYLAQMASLAEKARKYALRSEQVVYNKPKALNYGVPSRITASIASSSIADAIRTVKDGKGKIVTNQALFAPRVRAELMGSKDLVDIQAPHEPIRLVSDAGNATWTWYVTPKTTQAIELRLSFYNVVKVEGVAGETDGPTYTDMFVINATAAQKIKAFVADAQPYYAMIAGFFTTLSGIAIWVRGWRAKRSNQAPIATKD